MSLPLVAQDEQRKDMLLRLKKVDEDPGAKRTLIYWHVKGNDLADRVTAINTSIAGTLGQEAGIDEPAVPGTIEIEAKRLLLLQRDINGYVGLTINPPVPTITLLGDEGKAVSRFTNKGGKEHEDSCTETGTILPWVAVCLLIILCVLAFWVGKRYGMSMRDRLRPVNAGNGQPPLPSA